MAVEEELYCAEGRRLFCERLVGAGIRGERAEVGEVEGAQRAYGVIAVVELEGGRVPDSDEPAREMAPCVLERKLGARGGGEQRAGHEYGTSRKWRRDYLHADILHSLLHFPTPPPMLRLPRTTRRALASLAPSALAPHFDRPLPPPPPAPPAPLCGLPPLTAPDALQPLTRRTVLQADALVARIAAAPAHPDPAELRQVVKNLDRLSDVLCGVIDTCELVRNVHPDPRWIEETEKTYETLCSFMNQLNTHRGLYDVGLGIHASVAHPPSRRSSQPSRINFPATRCRPQSSKSPRPSSQTLSGRAYSCPPASVPDLSATLTISFRSAVRSCPLSRLGPRRTAS